MLLELTAVVLALAYVVLAIRENRLCWAAALVSSGLYTLIFWRAALLMESALQVFYAVMAVYGWLHWGSGSTATTLAIRRWSTQQHLLALGAILLISTASGTLLHYYTRAALPWLDSLTTVAALVATWMVTQKVLENWLYWIVIDAVSIYLYLSRDLHLTAGLFLGYTLLAWAGWQTWRQHYAQQSSVAVTRVAVNSDTSNTEACETPALATDAIATPAMKTDPSDPFAK